MDQYHINNRQGDRDGGAHYPENTYDLPDLERVWPAEVQETHAVIVQGVMLYFDRCEQQVCMLRGV